MAALAGYLTTIGFGNALITALDNQGLVTITDLEDLQIKDVKEILNVVRNPGGEVVNPAYVVPAAARAAAAYTVPQFLRDRGTSVPYLNEKNLRSLVYYVAYLKRTQKTFDAGTAMRRELARVWAQHELEVSVTDDPTAPTQLLTISKIMEMFDTLELYLQKKRGIEGNPLAYIVREHVYGAAPATGGALPGGPWASIDAEIISRAPHSGQTYAHDNAEVFMVLYTVFHGTEQWPWIASYKKAKDGRGAYLAAVAHFQGSGVTAKLLTAANTTLKSSFYAGWKR